MTKTKLDGEIPVRELSGAIADLEIRCHTVPWDGRVEFCIVGRSIGPTESRRYAQVTNLVLKTLEEGELLEPTFRLRHENVQALMDELYRAGVRPSEQGTAGELAATKAHLKDMRALVAQALDIPTLGGK